MTWRIIQADVSPNQEHDHVGQMTFGRTTVECTCGAKWMLDERGRWACIAPGVGS